MAVTGVRRTMYLLRYAIVVILYNVYTLLMPFQYHIKFYTFLYIANAETNWRDNVSDISQFTNQGLLEINLIHFW